MQKFKLLTPKQSKLTRIFDKKGQQMKDTSNAPIKTGGGGSI